MEKTLYSLVVSVYYKLKQSLTGELFFPKSNEDPKKTPETLYVPFK